MLLGDPAKSMWPTRSSETKKTHVDVSENSGTPKISILIGFCIINHPFWGTPIKGNTHVGYVPPKTNSQQPTPLKFWWLEDWKTILLLPFWGPLPIFRGLGLGLINFRNVQSQKFQVDNPWHAERKKQKQLSNRLTVNLVKVVDFHFLKIGAFTSPKRIEKKNDSGPFSRNIDPNLSGFVLDWPFTWPTQTMKQCPRLFCWGKKSHSKTWHSNR